MTSIVILLTTVVVGIVVRPQSVAAADGYTLSSSTVYRLDETVPAVFVEATYDMTNTTPDRNVDGGVRYFYFTGTRVPIDVGATELSVQVNGNDAEYEVVDAGNGFQALEVRFRSNLRYRKTATIAVRYRLPGSAPRSDDSFVRVNSAYVSFPVLAYGDDGMAGVSVDVPATWSTDYVGDDLTVRVENGRQLFEAGDIASPYDFGVMFTARSDDRLVSTPVVVGDSKFELRSWPEDTEWQQFATRHVSEGLPVLERLTGTPWPEANETDVIETSTPYLRGYAGYYYADTDVIEVGEELDSHTMLHELSHAWFNDSHISDRWLSEGLADEIGARGVAALGDPLPSPDDYDAPNETAPPSEFALNAWSQPTSAFDDADEYYGYKTSFSVLRALYDEIGEDKMADLLAAVLAGDRAYPNEPSADPPAKGAASVDWREFLDLAEQVGGSQQLVDSYRDVVVTVGQERDLDERAAMITRYDALAERGGAWLPPEAVRKPMSQWMFASAGDAIDAADGLLDVRDELAATLEPIELQPSPMIEETYQDAVDLDAAASDLDQHLDAAERIVDARADLVEHLTALELDVPQLSQSEYDEAPLGWAADTEQLAGLADELESDVTELDDTLAEYTLTVPALDAGAFVESPEGALDVVATAQEAADEVVESHRQHDDAGSLLDKIGAFGSSAGEQLELADQQLAAGDTAAAITSAEGARAKVDNWDARGRTRLLIAGAILVAVLLGLLIWVVVRRHRRGVTTSDDEPAPGLDADTAPESTSVESETVSGV